MSSLHPLVIVAVAALIHASFQLSVSVQTLLSGHAIGSRTSQFTLLRLLGGFTLGVVVMTGACLSFMIYLMDSMVASAAPSPLLWSVGCGLIVGLAIATWSLYYRKGAGTALWLPRPVARFLSVRAKHTKRSAEAFSLGASSVILEVLFLVVPMAISALALRQLPLSWQLIGFAGYVVIATMPQLLVTTLISGGHKLSSVQRWRETNKKFLQVTASSGLLVLGFYVYVEQIMTVTAYASGGGL